MRLMPAVPAVLALCAAAPGAASAQRGRMTVHLRLRALALGVGGLALGSCAGDPTAPGSVPDYLQLAAVTSSPTLGYIQTTVTMTARTVLALDIEYGACSVGIRVFPTVDRTEPVWDSDHQSPFVCPAVLILGRLEPGKPHAFVFSAAVAEVLGDSLPPGRYYFSATVGTNLGSYDVRDAGELELAVPER